MKMLAPVFFAAIILCGPANAAKDGGYQFVFQGDNPAQTFSVCFNLMDGGVEPPFQDVGLLYGENSLVYGPTNGFYVVHGDEWTVILDSRLGNVVYGYTLTAKIGKAMDITNSYDARYVIAATAISNPPAPPRPGGYAIVNTGSFTFTKHCHKNS